MPSGMATVTGLLVVDGGKLHSPKCWDWFDADWHDNSGATVADTHGPLSGDNRALRTGSWLWSGLRCASRAFGGVPLFPNTMGFTGILLHATGYRGTKPVVEPCSYTSYLRSR